MDRSFLSFVPDDTLDLISKNVLKYTPTKSLNLKYVLVYRMEQLKLLWKTYVNLCSEILVEFKYEYYKHESAL